MRISQSSSTTVSKQISVITGLLRKPSQSVKHHKTPHQALHLYHRATSHTMPKPPNVASRPTKGTLHDFFRRVANKNMSSKPAVPSSQPDADTHELSRFLSAQSRSDTYDRAIRELQRGEKRSHWMWFIFPQVEGLAHSFMSQDFAIKSWDEAAAYLRHPVLGERLRRASKVVLDSEEGDVEVLMGGQVDALKLRSCMTLFALATREFKKGEESVDSGEVFERVLGKYFDGEPDQRTVDIVRDQWQIAVA